MVIAEKPQKSRLNHNLTTMTFKRVNWGVIPMFFIAFSVFLASCNKDNFEGPAEESPEQPQKIEIDIHALPDVVTIDRQKVLKFGNTEHFKTTLDSISKMNSTALNRWESQVGFVSMRNQFDKLEEQYEHIRSQEQLDQFRNTNRSKVRFSSEGEIQMLVDMYHVGSLINPNGLVQVGPMVQQFTADRVISIGDGDITKLERARSLTESAVSEEIYISPIEVSPVAARGNGPDELNCESNFDSDNRRVKMKLEVKRWTSPYYNCFDTYECYTDINGQLICGWVQNCFPTGDFEVICNMELQVKSQRKGFLGIAWGSKADIDATFGANVHEVTTSGTTNHWMPVNESETDEKKLERTYSVDYIPFTSSVPNYCFGPTHVAGIINGGTNCHVWN